MTTPDRLQASLQAIFDAQLDRLKFYILWEYQVEKASEAGTPPVVTCQLTSVDPTMPDATVVVRPGPDGSISTPAVGSTVLVGFAGADPSKPYIFATDPNSPPTHVWIAGGGQAVARKTDEITITVAQIAGHLVANLSTGAVTASSDVKGSITGGSGKVESG